MRFGKLGPLHVIILLWITTLVSPVDGVEAKNKTVYALGINCVPGTFITSNSGCQKCPSGTFSDKSNSTKCSPCDRCIGNHNEVIKSCTSSSNTKCACEPGYYYNTDLTFCLKCTQCKKGRGVVRNCTATSNTKCEPCVKGRTFSGKKSLERCQTCARCAKGHIVQKECTRRSDTVCVPEKDKNNSKVPRIPMVSPGTVVTRPPARNRTATTKKKRWKSSTVRVSTEPVAAQNESSTPVSLQDEDTDSEDDTGLQAALYSLIAVVVVLIVVFVLVCRYKRRDRPRKKTKPGGEEPSTRSNSTEAVENPYSSLPFISKQGDKLLRNVSYSLFSELALHLNPGERWKQLGGQLKFNITQVNTFALDKGNATQAMLEQWGQKEGATVVALQNTFRKMKWTKEERIVEKYV